MPTLENQQGFTAIEAILVVLLAGAIGTAAYYAYQAHRDTTKSVAASSPSPTPTPSKLIAPTPTPAPEATWLDMTELGIKIPVTAQLSGLTYAYDSATDSAGLSTKQVTSLDPDCAADGSSPPGGMIGESTSLTQDGYQVAASDNTLSFKVSGKYVYIDNPQATCSENSTVQTQAADLWPFVRAAFLKAQPL